MKICSKCGSLMFPSKDKNKTIFICRRCGSKIKVDNNVKYKFSEKIEKDPFDSIPIIESKIETLPKIDVKCPECDHGEAVWWTQQTRSSDEPETRFFRCTKCEHTWREYS